jgi:hypothetical protein
MILASFGDSFIFGTDLKDAVCKLPETWKPSQQTWPALIAQQLQHDYQCFAQPGVGNNQILQQIIKAVAQYSNNAIYIANWTWIDRFDYVSVANNDWHTVRPSLDNPDIDKLYYKTFHSELADKFNSLVYINAAIDILQQNNCKFLMTYMDHLLLDQTWHAPDHVVFLQNRIKQHLKTFDGLTFLEWSRKHRYKESQLWHPLEDAHVAAAQLWNQEVHYL